MKSVIFSTATRYLLPMLLLFSVYILLRGHNQPGGGFIGGLAAASAFAMYALAFTVDHARKILWIDPKTLIGIGLLTSVSSGMFSLITGQPYMTGLWGTVQWPTIGKLGTPLMFDVGVYLVVIGISLLIIFTLAEDE